MTPDGGVVKLQGRLAEREALEDVLRSLRDGRSRALVLRGEAGVGKSALLDHLADAAAFARVLRVTGVESEAEISYSALQQLCAPLLEHLPALGAPQREALSTAFGLGHGPAPDRLLIGLAVLNLLSEAAGALPLLCIVDDAQWLDTMSAVILGFVSRRLSAESVGLVFAARSTADARSLDGLPELQVDGLNDEDARALLDTAVRGPLDPRIRDRIVADSHGNPLALLSLPRELSTAELEFGFGGTPRAPAESAVERAYRQRVLALPAETRLMLLTAAVEPLGDPTLLWGALEILGIGPSAAAAAEADGLVHIGARVRFAHPVVRSAAWRHAAPLRLHEVHAALAEVTDPVRDPDRRVWHRAHAASGPDEALAVELEQSAERARSRGGRSAAAAFLERSAELTLDPGRRGSRLISAADALAEAGSFARIPTLLAAAEVGPVSDLDRARIARVRAQVSFRIRHGHSAVRPLLEAARSFHGSDPTAARDTYLMALDAAMFAGRFGGDDLHAVAMAARAGAAGGEQAADRLLQALVARILDGRATAAPLMNQALDAVESSEDEVGLLWVAATLANEVFRYDVADRLSERAVGAALRQGELSLVPSALAVWANSKLDAGRLAEASDLLDQISAVNRSIGSSSYHFGLILTAYRGPADTALGLVASRLADAVRDGDGRQFAIANLAAAMVNNALGDHAAALEAAQTMTEHTDIALYHWGLRELAEAAALAGRPELAADARDRLAESTSATPTRAAVATQKLVDALASTDAGAERRYREAIAGFDMVETAVNGCRARLLFGGWLLRSGRLDEARLELRGAYDALSRMGADLLAERARRELASAGEVVRATHAAPVPKLTSQEAAIARLVASGQTNREIGSMLFLSPRTVEWHLGKVFAKLGVASRRELAALLRVA